MLHTKLDADTKAGVTVYLSVLALLVLLLAAQAVFASAAFGGEPGEPNRTASGQAVAPNAVTGFSAKTAGSAVQLAWTTATAQAGVFTVERAIVSNAAVLQWETITTIVREPGRESVELGFSDAAAKGKGNVLAYRLVQADAAGNAVYSPTLQVRFHGTTDFALSSAYPNPVSAGGSGGTFTTLGYTVSRPGDVRLSVYDAAGREIGVLAEGFHDAGSYTTSFNAAGMQAGVLAVVLQSGNERSVQKLMVIR